MRSNILISVVGVVASLAIGGCAHKAATAPAVVTAAPAPAPAKRVIAIDAVATPRVVVTEKGIAVTEKIQFDVGKANILAASDGLLGEVATVLKANSHLALLEVEGHTSSEGTAAVNDKLSQERADAVKAWLVKHGIDAARLQSKGYGSANPIGDNANEAGREKNRRVDFTVIKETPEAPAAQ